MRAGTLVALEGLDGAGTTTQLRCLADALRAEGRAVVATAEPSDGPVGLLLRQALRGRLQLPGGRGPLSEATMALLFAADRMDHLAAVIEPALQAGAIVLTDRYVLSSLAYQGPDLGHVWPWTLNERARRADLTLYFELPASVAERRRATRGAAVERYEASERQRRVQRAYAAARTRHGRRLGPVVSIDATGAVEAVTARALAAIHRALERRP